MLSCVLVAARMGKQVCVSARGELQQGQCKQTRPDDQLYLPRTQVIQSLSYRSEWSVDVQEAELIRGEVLAFLNPVEGVQRGLETYKPFNLAAFKHKEIPVCLKNLSVFTRLFSHCNMGV